MKRDVLKQWFPHRVHLITFCVLLLYAGWRFGFDLLYNWDLYVNSADAIAMEADGRHFTLLARSLLNHGEYRLDEGSPPYSLHTPGFSLFLAAHMLVFGKYWLVGVFASHVLIGIWVVACAYAVLVSMRGHNTALLGGFLTASYAPYHYLAFIVYREALSLGLFASFLLIINHKWYRKWTFTLMGCALGCIAFVREEFVLLTPTCLAVIWWMETGGTFRRNWRRAAWKSLAVIALIGAIFLPWIIRNAVVFHRFQAFGSLGGVQLYMGNNPTLSATQEYDYAYIAKIKEFETHATHEVGDIYFKKATRYIVSHPFTTLRNMIGKTHCLFSVSVHNLDDFPAIIFGLTCGLAITAALKLKGWKRSATTAAITVLFLVFARRGVNAGLLYPNVEFGSLRFFGIIAFLWFLLRREFPEYALGYLSLLAVNLIFIPQHRHRWIIDLLLIIWTAAFLHDVLLFITQKLSSGKRPKRIHQPPPIAP